MKLNTSIDGASVDCLELLYSINAAGEFQLTASYVLAAARKICWQAKGLRFLRWIGLVHR
jgi:hypothetical protein